MSRDAELDAFKRVNLSLIASDHGYAVVRSKSTRHSVLMANGADKIIVAKEGGHYIYCSVHDPASSGTAIDFAQKVIEPGCSLGRVRQLLRPYTGGRYIDALRERSEGRYATEIGRSRSDLLGVAARFSRFEPITDRQEYLNDERGVPRELLLTPELAGRVYTCPIRGSLIFPHYDISSADEPLTGYEIKDRGVSLFSKGGRKTLWSSAATSEDSALVLAESGLDALSYLAMRSGQGTRVASIGGHLSQQQIEVVTHAIHRLPKSTAVVAAFDNDQAGDRLTERLRAVVEGVGRRDLEFKDDRPVRRGRDWNQVLVDRNASSVTAAFSGQSLSR